MTESKNYKDCWKRIYNFTLYSCKLWTNTDIQNDV